MSVTNIHVKNGKFCCKMRERYLIGVISVNPHVPDPIDIVDYVVRWEPRIVMRIKFCPFCGQTIQHAETVRDGKQGT